MNKKVTWIIIIAVIIAALFIYIKYYTGEAVWERDKCRADSKCFPGDADCDRDVDCLTGYCAKGAGAKYGYPRDKDVCECPNGQGWNNETLTCYTCPQGQIPDSETFDCVSGI